MPSAFYSTYLLESRESHLPPRPPRTQPLAGTVPYHVSYLLLHTHQAPESWPKTFTFPLYTELKEKLAKYNALVNVCWTSTSPSSSPNLDLTSPSRPVDPEVYSGTLWKTGNDQTICKRVTFPIITADTILSIFEGDDSDGGMHPGPGVDLKLTDHDTRSAFSAFCSVESRIAAKKGKSIEKPSHYHCHHSGPYFYVCCHGHRDCRCGIRGGDLADALASELRKRDMLFDEQGQPRLGRVGHVGGHKNAPNVIVFPYGDWYGNLYASDLPALVNQYVQSPQSTTSRSESPSPPSCSLSDLPNQFQWRGRMGMTKEAQQAVWDNWAQHNSNV